jgi:hypothetical protein
LASPIGSDLRLKKRELFATHDNLYRAAANTRLDMSGRYDKRVCVIRDEFTPRHVL